MHCWVSRQQPRNYIRRGGKEFLRYLEGGVCPLDEKKKVKVIFQSRFVPATTIFRVKQSMDIGTEKQLLKRREGKRLPDVI